VANNSRIKAYWHNLFRFLFGPKLHLRVGEKVGSLRMHAIQYASADFFGGDREHMSIFACLLYYAISVYAPWPHVTCMECSSRAPTLITVIP